MRSLSRPIAIVLFAALFAASLTAQQSDTAPRFRTETNLVLVPVQVRSHGQHLSDLKKESFVLLQDGKPQKISVFEEVRTTTQRLQRVPVGPNEFTNRLLGSPETARYTIIAIDRINTTTMDMQRLRTGLMQFLSHAADTGDPIRLISIEAKGIRIIQDFTTDPKTIAVALQRANTPAGQAQPSSVMLDETLQEAEATATANSQNNSDAGGERLAAYLQRLDSLKDSEQNMIAFQQRSQRISSLEALQQIALSLAGLPGRKSLVWASSGYPFASISRQGRSSVTYNFSQVNEALALDAYTTNLLNSSNVAMYPIDARGMVNTAWDAMDPTHKYSPTNAEKQGRQDANQDVITTFERLAAGTGGRPCYNRPELSGCFKDALDDARDYYMLGYYVDTKGLKDGWHKLQVKVDEKGANVRSRNGFLFPLPDPSATREYDVSTAINSLLLDSGIPFRGEWTTRQKKGAKISNGFYIQIVPEANVVDTQQNRLNLEFVGVARAKDGTIAGQFGQKVERTLPPEAISTIQHDGITYKNALELPPGDYLVRLVVRDNNTGRTGAVSTLLKVE